MVKVENLLGQEVGVGGPANSTNIHHNVTGGGEVELGVEGEEEERYVERFILNENTDEEARLLREQQHNCHLK
ncbi:hypothetical protein L195_g033023, partial [Trifolium pratense]